jgi:hydroxymethylpyrimidine/phosphomethylpyrimidine kinase
MNRPASAAGGRVLVIAGSDSGGGAGVQADIKTITALGSYAATAITALTAQNTMGVFGVVDVPPEFIVQQIGLVLDDIGADVVKTGMLSKPAAIEAIAGALAGRAAGLPLVVDPVMVAKGGHKLLDDNAHAALLGLLVPRATVLTPNLPEAEALTGLKVDDPPSMVAAGQALKARGARAVLVKGGHLAGTRLIDVLVSDEGTETFEDMRIDTAGTHGTGCTLASAIAAGLARGLSVKAAVIRARRYVRLAIASAPGYGHGHGPLNHAHTVRPFDV